MTAPALTARQRQVVRLLLAGTAPKRAARELGIEWTTYRVHVTDIRKRVGAEQVSPVRLYIILSRIYPELAPELNDAA